MLRFLRITGLSLLVLLLLPFVAVHFFGDAIARQVVTALNERLQTEITVRDYDLSLLRTFPYLAADLRDVTVAGSDGSRLLTAGRLACRLDLGSVFGRPRVTGIVVSDGSLNLIIDEDGNPNYLLTGYTPVGERPPAAAAFRIDAARLRNLAIRYEDRRLRSAAQLTATDATLGGDFGARRYVLTTDADLDVDYVEQDGFRYLSRQSVRLLGQITIDHEAGTYTLAPFRAYAGDFSAEVSGSLMPGPEGVATDLTLSSTSGNLEDVFALLPPAYAAPLAELETQGALELTATVQGDWTAVAYPRVEGRLHFGDGRLGSPRLNVGIRDLELQATFAYLDGPRGGVQTFAVDRLTGTFRGEAFDLGLRLEDLNDPVVTFRADGALPLETLPAFLPEGPVREGAGRLRLRDVTVSGRYADMRDPRRMGRVGSSGTVDLDGATLKLPGGTLRVPAGQLELDNNALRVRAATLETEGSRMVLDGEATNFIPVLFADSLNSRDAALRFSGTLIADRLDVNELLTLNGPDTEADTVADDRRDRTLSLLDGRFDATAATWRWDALHGEEFRGQLFLNRGRMELRGESEAMGGAFRVDAVTRFGADTHTRARVTTRGVDVREFFAQNANFGQDFLTADHLSGRMDARLLLEMDYDSTGAVDYDRLYALAALEITRGELHDFPMLENFAFALKAGDLERVRFTRLANYLEISDRTVYLPAMEIRSSAINLTVSGSHTFDQYLDYYVKVNAGQVIANKISRHDDRLEVLPARNGLFNLYYTIAGPLDTYAVRTDKRAVKDAFAGSAFRRDRIRRILQERFRTPIELLPPQDDGDVGE